MKKCVSKLGGSVLRSTESMARSFGGVAAATPAAGPAGFTLPDLPYDFGALEPVLPARLMELHHSFHHKAYVTNLNASLEKREAAMARGDLAEVTALDGLIKFNGGGHINHSLFWKNLAPSSSSESDLRAESAISQAICQEFGSVEAFQSSFNAQTAAVQGSGWGWLVFDQNSQRLMIQTKANQDPVTGAGIVPLLGIDVWEHAYYLKYENRRPEYLTQIWQVINWVEVQKRYVAAIAQ